MQGRITREYSCFVLDSFRNLSREVEILTLDMFNIPTVIRTLLFV